MHIASVPEALVCLDATGESPAPCSLTVKGKNCGDLGKRMNGGDVGSCLAVTKVEILADDGKRGACMHFDFENRCEQEIFTKVCVQQADDPGDWWCTWGTSSSGASFAFQRCQVSGKYIVATATDSASLEDFTSVCLIPF